RTDYQPPPSIPAMDIGRHWAKKNRFIPTMKSPPPQADDFDPVRSTAVDDGWQTTRPEAGGWMADRRPAH
ncbi:hypothetical protein EIP91_005192, partial [Steccherinum ochraceum]